VKVSASAGAPTADQRFPRLGAGRCAGAVQSGLQGGVGQWPHPTVKLSDNPNKAMGPADQIERYKRVFGRLRPSWSDFYMNRAPMA
jgi:hypothetical protein